MTSNLPAIDLAAAGDRRRQRLQRLAGKLRRDALAGAADAEDTAIALAIAMLVVGGRSKTADALDQAAVIADAITSVSPTCTSHS